MATVPGNPDDDGGIPKELRPTQADLLIAAGIMHQQGAFDPQPQRLAMDTSKLSRPSQNVEDVRGNLFDPGAPPMMPEQRRVLQFRTQEGYWMQQGLGRTTSGKIKPEDELGDVLRFRRNGG